MRLDEPARRSLYDALASALGDNQADTLMNLLPQHPLADMATRDDLNALALSLRGEMAIGFGKVDHQLGEIRSEMAELRGEIGKLSGDLRADFSQQVLMLGLLLGGSILAVLGTLLTLGFTGAFA
jgi:hypothetical protein